MLQEISPGYAGQAQQETHEAQQIDQTADQNELKLIKAQADMLATELAQEKARLEKFNRHICLKCDECEALEAMVSYLMAQAAGAGVENINLHNKRLMLIGGPPAYAKLVEYYVASLGGEISVLPSEMSARQLDEHDQQISEADMVLFLSKTFSELELWNATRNICEKYGTKFTILSKATISCFSNRLCAAF